MAWSSNRSIDTCPVSNAAATETVFSVWGARFGWRQSLNCQAAWSQDTEGRGSAMMCIYDMNHFANTTMQGNVTVHRAVVHERRDTDRRTVPRSKGQQIPLENTSEIVADSQWYFRT